MTLAGAGLRSTPYFSVLIQRQAKLNRGPPYLAANDGKPSPCRRKNIRPNAECRLRNVDWNEAMYLLRLYYVSTTISVFGCAASLHGWIPHLSPASSPIDCKFRCWTEDSQVEQEVSTGLRQLQSKEIEGISMPCPELFSLD